MSIPPVADTWRGKAITLDADWARFCAADLDEATTRLRRYAELYRLTVTALSDATLDESRAGAWTIRQICHHVAGIVDYARQLGDLTVSAPSA